MKNYVIYYLSDDGVKQYVKSINMRCKEEKDISFVEDIGVAKCFDEVTATNIIIMNWWRDEFKLMFSSI